MPKYSAEIEKTKKALVDVYTRAKDVHEDIEQFNVDDNFDELEIATSRRESLFDRIEYLKARLQPEVADWLNQRKTELPSEILELNKALNKHRQDLDAELRPKIKDILVSLLELGAKQTTGSIVTLPDGYSKYLKQAAREVANTSPVAKMQREIADKKQELQSPDRIERVCTLVNREATDAAAKAGFNQQRHYITPCFRKIRGRG